MASLLCGSFHVSSNHHSDWRIPVTFVIWSRQMASTLIKIDHIPLLWYAAHRTPKTCFLRRYRHHALRNLTCACLYCLLLCYCSLPKKFFQAPPGRSFYYWCSLLCISIYCWYTIYIFTQQIINCHSFYRRTLGILALWRSRDNAEKGEIFNGWLAKPNPVAIKSFLLCLFFAL